MRVALVQARAIPGDLPANLERHEAFVEEAAARGARMVVFPELSLTGYEPTLARALAVRDDNPALGRLQDLGDAHGVVIAAGMPTRGASGTRISLALLQPGKPCQIYSKMHLHADEEPFFVPGEQPLDLIGGEAGIALAICYEISVDEHAASAARRGAKVYLASVAKFTSGIDAAFERLAGIARAHSMTVLMANCVGEADGQACAGRTAAWRRGGALIGRLGDTEEGVLVVDTASERLVGPASAARRGDRPPAAPSTDTGAPV